MSVGAVNKNTGDRIPTAGNPLDKVGNLASLHTTEKSDAVSAINEVKDEQANKADMDIVADAFSAAETYAEGDYCTYEGGLYKFKTSHSGAWDAADVDQIQIAGELSELKNTLTSATPRTATGTTAAQLTSALNALTTEQKARCAIAINGNKIILRQGQDTVHFDSISVTSSGIKMYRYNTTLSAFYEFLWSTSLTSQEITVTSWTLYYQGVPLS